MLSARPKTLIAKTGALAAILLLMGAMLGFDPPTARYSPTPMGVSGGNVNDSWRRNCCSGTLGALVQDGAGTQYILSNNHVLARLNKASVGEDISQPGLIDVNCAVLANDVVADFTAYVPMTFNGSANTVDAAIAEVVPGKVIGTGEILNIGTISGNTQTPSLGTSVQKNGRTSNYTTGSITTLGFSGNVGYTSKCGGRTDRIAFFTGSFLVTPGSFSTGGDSGSLILTSGASPNAVGLLYAGSSSFTIACPIDAVLSEFNVSLVGGPPPTTGTVVGTVTEAGGGPIAGASVSASTGQSDTTDGSGDYTLNGVPTGSRTITASAAGYTTQQQSTTVTDGGTSTVNFALSASQNPTQAIVDCITYWTTGGGSGVKDLRFSVAVVDDFGGAVDGASVTVSLTRDGGAFGTATGTTDAAGVVSFRARNAPGGCYEADVTDVTASGLSYDGTEPANGFFKGSNVANSDVQPDADCRSGSDGCGVNDSGGSTTGFTGTFQTDAIQGALEVKSQNEDWILDLPGVAGIGVGRMQEFAAIQIFLEQEDPELRLLLPSDLEGYPVEIIISGPFTAR